jgi:hypothetical protein
MLLMMISGKRGYKHEIYFASNEFYGVMVIISLCIPVVSALIFHSPSSVNKSRNVFLLSRISNSFALIPEFNVRIRPICNVFSLLALLHKSRE